MKHFVFFVLSAAVLAVNSGVYGQKEAFRTTFFAAEAHIQEMNYALALPLLQKLNEMEPENGNVQFKLGFCFLNLNGNKDQAVSYLRKANEKASKGYDPNDYEDKSAPFETPFFLAQAYFHNHQFIEAEKLFQQFRSDVEKMVDEQFLDEIDRYLAFTNNAARLVSQPIDVKIQHLPEGINTRAIEYGPVVSGDETTLIFTSNRNGDQKASLESSDDLFIAKKEGEIWGEPERMSSINTAGHEASVSLSFDGNTLVLYRNDGGDGNLYISEFDGASWSTPELMPDVINSLEQETHGCFSVDKNEFFFSSNRPGGYGGLDIYVTRKLPNGYWGEPENLGPEINTPYDEDTPFLHPDNKRLYFSSSGHRSMGGLDVFVAVRMGDYSWRKPVNIGYPINSTSDDVCFTVSADGKRGYYSSFSEQSFGETDLFMIEMPGEDHTNLMVYTGYAKDESGQVIMNAEITVFDQNTGELFGVYSPNPRTGKFVLAASQGKELEVNIEANGYDAVKQFITVGKAEANEPGMQEMAIDEIKMKRIYRVPVQLLMPYDDCTVEAEALGDLISVLQTFEECNVLLTGHTDSKGPSWYNNRLSKKRAAFVKKMLVDNGISPTRIQTEGKGEDHPIAQNSINGKDSPEGRAFNRRVTVSFIDFEEEPNIERLELQIPDSLKVN
ncbi:MAG: OmpA family protein [Salinivirgaceae bacterium]